MKKIFMLLMLTLTAFLLVGCFEEEKKIYVDVVEFTNSRTSAFNESGNVNMSMSKLLDVSSGGINIAAPYTLQANEYRPNQKIYLDFTIMVPYSGDNVFSHLELGVETGGREELKVLQQGGADADGYQILYKSYLSDYGNGTMYEYEGQVVIPVREIGDYTYTIRNVRLTGVQAVVLRTMVADTEGEKTLQEENPSIDIFVADYVYTKYSVDNVVEGEDIYLVDDATVISNFTNYGELSYVTVYLTYKDLELHVIGEEEFAKTELDKTKFTKVFALVEYQDKGEFLDLIENAHIMTLVSRKIDSVYIAKIKEYSKSLEYVNSLIQDIPTNNEE